VSGLSSRASEQVWHVLHSTAVHYNVQLVYDFIYI
jgi:hypothetical protein